MSHLMNYVLTAADYHANGRGFGTDRLNPDGKTWVLSRFAIEMSRIPSRHESFYVETWVESVNKLFTNRNFRIVSAGRCREHAGEDSPSGTSVSCGGDAGSIIGYGRSVWAMIDISTRQPVDLTEAYGGRIGDYIVDPVKDSAGDDLLAQIAACVRTPIEKPSRIPMDGDCAFVRKVETYFSDVDFNGHINSVRYIDHILDTFPLVWHRDRCAGRLDIAFVAEGRGEEPLEIYSSEAKRTDLHDGSPATEYSFRIIQRQNHETCRCRIRFRELDKQP